MGKGIKWTKEQLEAIKTENNNLLVAAAAGSGKTAVLVERIIQGVLREKSPLDLDRLLVVTFTEAAAAEMRDRISEALKKALAQDPKNEYLQRQFLSINKASISTIHSFCLSIIKEYFYLLDLDPLLTVMGENESILLKQEVLDRILEKKYEKGEADFLSLTASFGAGREEKLGELVLRLENFLATQISPEKWLAESLSFFIEERDKNLEMLPWYPMILEIIEDLIKEGLWNLERATMLSTMPNGPFQYIENLKDEIAFFQEISTFLAKKPCWDDLCTKILAAKPFARMPSVRQGEADARLKDRVTELRNRAKSTLAEAQNYCQRKEEELLRELYETGPILEKLSCLAIELKEEYQKEKKQKGQVDFNDLERYALNILGHFDEATGELIPTEIALALQEKYQSVMIDEYQDTNDLQEGILKLVSRQGWEKPNLFMVGDVKQSIYRFRQANPSLFLKKYETFTQKKGDINRKILLRENFRSRREITEGTNLVFEQIMTAEIGGLAYDQDAKLVYGANYPSAKEGEQLVAGPIEMHLISRDSLTVEVGENVENTSLEELSALEREAHLIAKRIQSLLGFDGEPPLKIWDKKTKKYRRLEYRDLVILLRSTKDKANIFLDILQQYEIPAYAEVSTGYFQATEVGIILSLLRIIDNPIQDIHLVAVLRSPLVGLTTAELARIRANWSGGSFWQSILSFIKDQPKEELALKLKGFLERLDRWRTQSRRGPLNRLIWQIYQETEFLDYAGAMPGGKQRKANLYALYERAVEFDSFARHGLFRFLRFIEKLQEQNEDLGLAGAFGESDNVVKIMSIHKSKGLEFPVVFLANLGGQFNLLDSRQELLLHQDGGFGPLYFDLDHRIKYPTIAHWAIKEEIIRESLAEELRILYVAFTRAREKLILVGSVRKLAERIEDWQETSLKEKMQLAKPELRNARSYLDWLGPALVGKEEILSIKHPGIFQFFYWGLSPEEDLGFLHPHLEDFKSQVNLDYLEELCFQAKKDEELQQFLNEKFLWDYPYQITTGLPAKLTVTEAKKFSIEDEEAEKLIYKREIATRPEFLQKEKGLTKAELGTVMHLTMQHLDLKNVASKEAITQQVEDLVKKEFLTREQGGAVEVDKIFAFFQSPLGKRLRKAPADGIRREIPFTYRLVSEELMPQLPKEGSREEIIIQGIVDCLLLEEDGIVLIDYKNDQIKGRKLSQLINEYKPQLNLYEKAISDIFQMPIKEKYLYFFQLEENGGVVAV